GAGGSLPEGRVLEFRYQRERLEAARKAHRQELSARGLGADQIDQVELGQFLKEVVVRAPARSPEGGPALVAASAGPWWDEPAPLYEVEELKAQPGEQVQAGQVLCYLADHRHLYVEGRGFKEHAVLAHRPPPNACPPP